MSHILVIGETQSGKTYAVNKELHREFPGKSIFWNTNEVPDIWGTHVTNPAQLARVFHHEKASKINFIPSRIPEQANHQLMETVNKLFAWGRGSRGKIWCQLIVDEAQEYSREVGLGGQVDPVRLVATRGLGAYGIRLVALTQYPRALNTTTRTNLRTLIIFSPGREGLLFLQNRGFSQDVEAIEEWTRQKYHWVSYEGSQGPTLHPPV